MSKASAKFQHHEKQYIIITIIALGHVPRQQNALLHA
jgi:hypothetical protein